MTDAERVLWRALRETMPQHHWRKQVPLGSYFADFASHSAKTVIEVDGGQHADLAERDEKRTAFHEAEGYRVLRFWNNDVLGNVDGVLEAVARALTSSSPLVGEVGGGLAASAAEESHMAVLATAETAPPPNPPHEGEGLSLGDAETTL